MALLLRGLNSWLASVVATLRRKPEPRAQDGHDRAAAREDAWYRYPQEPQDD